MKSVVFLAVVALVTLSVSFASEMDLAVDPELEQLLADNEDLALLSLDDEPGDSSTPTGVIQASKTATGEPVLSANANEIVNIHDTNGPADAINDEGVEAERELKVTIKIQQKKRAERLEKHNQEQMFKSREQEKKDDDVQRRKDKFQEHMEKRTEESHKTVAEEGKKSEQKFDQKEKLANAKKDLAIKIQKRKAKAAKAQIEADKKAFETKAALEQKQLLEEEKKGKEKSFKFQQEQDRKDQRHRLKQAQRNEARGKRERLVKTRENDRKGVREKIEKRKVKREEAFKNADREERNKREARKDQKRKEKDQKEDIRELQRRKMQREKDRKSQEKDAKTEEKASKRQEAQRKQQERDNKVRMEQQKKAEKRAKERTRKNTNAVWCRCQHVHAPWAGNNQWRNCPGNTLVMGFHRYWRQDLAGLSHLYCCHACRPGGKVIPIQNCAQANWVHSFDRAGWSTCPNGKYVQGFYKSSCNWIYCLEYARCCNMKGTRGYRGCRGLGRWWGQFDYAGWKTIDGNWFMTGLYRNWCHYLYCIEMAMECLATAY